MTNKEDKTTTTPAESTSAKLAPSNPWDALKPGVVVLCRDTTNGKDGGWWPAEIKDTGKDPAILIMEWKGFASLGPFHVKRSAVAILPPKG